MNSLLLSIVIPAFNEERRLRHAVERIRAACDAIPSLAAAYEIIVCDNNSTDTTATVAEQAGCRVVCEPINQISRARNRGASVASGEWLLFVDADSWPPPELMVDVAALLGDTTCIGCGSTIRIVDGPRWFKYAWESKNWSMRVFRWCPGAFLLCRRDAFEEVNGFSEEYYLFEEGDFVSRLKKHSVTRGQRFIILHKHPFRTSGRRGIGQGFWWWVRFALRLSLSHNQAVRDRQFAQPWYKPDR